VTNWKAFEKLGSPGVGARRCITRALTAEAVGPRDLHHPQTPDQPIVLHIDAVSDGARQAAQGAAPDRPRRSLSATFETFERHIRDQLARSLGPGGSIPLATSSPSR